MSILWASLRREGARLRASGADLAMLTWVPLLAMALLCWIFSAGQPQRLPIALWNEDPGTALSRQLERMLQASPGLELRAPVLNRAEAQAALQSMAVYAVVHIPPDMARDVKQGRSASITLLHNAQLATASSLVQRDVRQVVGTLSAGIEMQAAAKRGTPGQALYARMEPIKTQLVALFNVSTNYELFLAAALMPALVHILAMTAGAWSVGRELRERTLGDWLGAPPVGLGPIFAALVGKLLIACLSLWACTMAALLYLAQLRGWAVAGSMAWIGLALALLVAVSLAAGAALSGLTLSLRTALSGAGFFSAPAFAFCGVAYPLLAMSPGARTWAEAMPYTHYARLQLEQWLMGAPLAQSLPTIAALGLATLVLLAAASAGLARGLRQPQRWGGR
ncbi:ABC transporter permease [Acidovorax sp. HDW3]|uniref:ABC transporter permease n=1 Tax=Acidovorax sp. HDW3 TaxID=2714923 RepID=UPI001F105F49|nr:ABC transporter permease [Acidovorax sp. HDW3]